MPLLPGPTGRTGAACAPTAAGWALNDVAKRQRLGLKSHETGLIPVDVPDYARA
jgi:hypothetical protein